MTVVMTIAPIDADVSEQRAFVATGRDITDEEQLEARQRSTERLSALGTLAGGIAHDFNNLLAPILGHSELIIKEGPESVRSRVESIWNAAERGRSWQD